MTDSTPAAVHDVLAGTLAALCAVPRRPEIEPLPLRSTAVRHALWRAAHQPRPLPPLRLSEHPERAPARFRRSTTRRSTRACSRSSRRAPRTSQRSRYVTFCARRPGPAQRRLALRRDVSRPAHRRHRPARRRTCSAASSPTAVRGLEFLLTRREVDAARVVVAGNDIALLTAALTAGATHVVTAPALFYRTAELAPKTQAYPLEEINDYLRLHPARAEAVRRTLANFDLVGLAPRVTAATLVASRRAGHPARRRRPAAFDDGAARPGDRVRIPAIALQGRPVQRAVDGRAVRHRGRGDHPSRALGGSRRQGAARRSARMSGGRGVDAEPALRDRREDLGECRGNGDVGQRAHAAGCRRRGRHTRNRLPSSPSRGARRSFALRRRSTSPPPAARRVGAHDEGDAWKQPRDFSTNVGALRQLDARPPRRTERASARTSPAASGGLSTLVTAISKATGCPGRMSSATLRQEEDARQCSGLNEPGSTPEAAATTEAQRSVGPRCHPRRGRRPRAGRSDHHAPPPIRCSARRRRAGPRGEGRGDSTAAGEPQHDRARDHEILLGRPVAASLREHDRARVGAGAAVVTAMWQRCSPCRGRSVTRPAVAPSPTSWAPVRRQLRVARSRARCAIATAVSTLQACCRLERPRTRSGRARVVGHHRFEQQARAAGHRAAARRSPAAAARDGEHGLAAGARASRRWSLATTRPAGDSVRRNPTGDRAVPPGGWWKRFVAESTAC